MWAAQEASSAPVAKLWRVQRNAAAPHLGVAESALRKSKWLSIGSMAAAPQAIDAAARSTRPRAHVHPSRPFEL